MIWPTWHYSLPLAPAALAPTPLAALPWIPSVQAAATDASSAQLHGYSTVPVLKSPNTAQPSTTLQPKTASDPSGQTGGQPPLASFLVALAEVELRHADLWGGAGQY